MKIRETNVDKVTMYELRTTLTNSFKKSKRHGEIKCRERETVHLPFLLGLSKITKSVSNPPDGWSQTKREFKTKAKGRKKNKKLRK